MSDTTPDTSSSTTHADPVALKAALDATREDLAGMAPSEIVATPGLDASAATAIAIGSLPRIAEQRAAVAEALGEQHAAALDALPTVAYAAHQANIELAAADAANDLGEMADALAEDHRLLLTDAEALAKGKLLDRSRIDLGRPVVGYRALVQSTLVLVSLLREHWASVSSRTPLTLGDLDGIERRAQLMLRALDEREQGSTRLRAADTRSRAMSKLVHVYGEVRRDITFVRWSQDDVDEIAPSLWSGRRGRTRTETAAPSPGAPARPTPSPPRARPRRDETSAALRFLVGLSFLSFVLAPSSSSPSAPSSECGLGPTKPSHSGRSG